MVGFCGLSLVAGDRLTLRTVSDERTASRAFMPMAAIVLAFTLVGLVVLSLPMGMRHGSRTTEERRVSCERLGS